MTVLAIINPQSLLGGEIKKSLGRRRELWSDVRLLGTEPAQVGAVTEFAGEAALVQECDVEALQGVRLAILLPGDEDPTAAQLSLPADSTLLVVDPKSGWHGATPAVAGIDSTEDRSGAVFISPSPVVILLAHLLQPLQDLGTSAAVAQILMPASSQGQAGLDELFDQTRSFLAVQDDKPTEVFGKQISFNLFPLSFDDTRHLDPLTRILGGNPAVALQVVQAGVFHCLACSLFLSFDQDPGLEKLRHCLAANPWIEMAGEGELPGPTDAAAREEILVADLRPSPTRPGSYQLWAVMDNLTRGGVSNVLGIVESLLAPAS